MGEEELLTWPAAEGREGEGDVPLGDAALVHGHAVVFSFVIGVHVRDCQWEVLLSPAWKKRIKMTATTLPTSVVNTKLFVSDPDQTFQEILDPDPDSDPDPISDPT